jgi:hypothetical protein
LPNDRLVGFELNAPVVTPVPERVILRLGFDPLDVIFTPPLAAPPDAGVNVTLNVVVCPAVSVTGSDSPLKLNPLPLAEAAVIVKLDPPEFVRVSDRLELFPT